MPRARTNLSLADWPEAKARILQHLAEGWSLNIAYSKAGVDRHGKFKACFKNDEEFKAQLRQYKQSTFGFYSVHDRALERAPSFPKAHTMGDDA